MVSAALTAMGQYPFLGVIAGIVMTAITQSSTAVTSMTVAMGISQVIILEGAVAIILGAQYWLMYHRFNGIPKAFLRRPSGFTGPNLDQRLRCSPVFPFISQFSQLVERTSPDLPRQIANAHTIFQHCC